MVLVDLRVRDSGQLTNWLRWRHGKRLRPGERTTSIELRGADGGSPEWLTVGANLDNVMLLSAELVKSLVIGGEGDGAGKSILDGVEVTLLRVNGQAVSDDLKGVLRHVWEHVEEALAVKSEVGVQRIRRRRDSEGVALEQDVEKDDANGPDVGLCGGVASMGWVILLWSHVTVTADGDLPRPRV